MVNLDFSKSAMITMDNMTVEYNTIDFRKEITKQGRSNLNDTLLKNSGKIKNKIKTLELE